MNPLSLARLGANIGIVVVMAAFVAAIVLGSGQVSNAWAWIIGGVALAGAASQFIVSLIWPSSIKSAWDEQVLASQGTANTFGYFATLAVFLCFLVLSLTDVMPAALAFYLLGVPLGVAPSVWMIFAHFQGRAG